MAFDVVVRVGRTPENEANLAAVGLLNLRWSQRRAGWVGRATAKAWTALGQNQQAFPFGSYEALREQEAMRAERHEPRRETLRKLARAIAVSDGNAFFGPLSEPADRAESQYFPEARHAAMALEGMGIDADAFVASLPDPGTCFDKVGVRPDQAGDNQEGPAPSRT